MKRRMSPRARSRMQMMRSWYKQLGALRREAGLHLLVYRDGERKMHVFWSRGVAP